MFWKDCSTSQLCVQLCVQAGARVSPSLCEYHNEADAQNRHEVKLLLLKLIATLWGSVQLNNPLIGFFFFLKNLKKKKNRLLVEHLGEKKIHIHP